MPAHSQTTARHSSTWQQTGEGSEETLKAVTVHLGALEVALGCDGGLARLLVEDGKLPCG